MVISREVADPRPEWAKHQKNNGWRRPDKSAAKRDIAKRARRVAESKRRRRVWAHGAAFARNICMRQDVVPQGLNLKGEIA
jgi:ferric-dicitrate binding protein FerR (iron transport regulator)